MNQKNPPITGKTFLERELTRVCGSYSKKKLNTNFFFPYIEKAIDQAKKFEEKERENKGWIQGIGSSVYKIVEKIIKN